MRVVLAVDKFKGSATAEEVAGALADGWRDRDPGAELVTVPVADGGDGTVAAVVARGWTPQEVDVTGPWGDPVRAGWARSPDGSTAVVELATASGIALRAQRSRPRKGPQRALAAHTTGTGELVAAAVAAGCREVVLAVGGSATSDGGAGLLRGLGARLLDAEGQEVPDGVLGLEQVATVDLGPLRDRMAGVRVVLAADVDNPLCGPRGAAAVYGPQKGVDPEAVARIDAALARWAGVLEAAQQERRADVSPSEQPGAGAAGGVGYAALAALGAQRVSGVGLVLDLVGLDDALVGADLVVTGEGRLDGQTLEGKAPAGVLAAGRAAGLPVVAVCGSSELTLEQAGEAGFADLLTLVEEEPDLQRCLSEPLPVLRRLGARLADRMAARRLDRGATRPAGAGGTPPTSPTAARPGGTR